MDPFAVSSALIEIHLMGTARMRGHKVASVPLISGVELEAGPGCPQPSAVPTNVFAGELDTFVLRAAAMEIFSAAELHANGNATRSKRLSATTR